MKVCALTYPAQWVVFHEGIAGSGESRTLLEHASGFWWCDALSNNR
jgi:hypothetical protein